MAPTCRLSVRLQYITQPHVGQDAGERDNLRFLPQLFLAKKMSYNKKFFRYTNTPWHVANTPWHVANTPAKCRKHPRKMSQTPPQNVANTTQHVANTTQHVANTPRHVTNTPWHVANTPWHVANTPQDVCDMARGVCDMLRDVGNMSQGVCVLMYQKNFLLYDLCFARKSWGKKGCPMVNIPWILKLSLSPASWPKWGYIMYWSLTDSLLRKSTFYMHQIKIK